MELKIELSTLQTLVNLRYSFTSHSQSEQTYSTTTKKSLLFHNWINFTMEVIGIRIFFFQFDCKQKKIVCSLNFNNQNIKVLM